LKKYDVLIMPTLPAVPGPISAAGDTGPLERLSRSIGMTYNTAPYNSTGHPALTLPVGFAPAKGDEKIKLPVGMQIVGRKFEDLTCPKVAAAWEKASNWKKL
jgi:amidase